MDTYKEMIRPYEMAAAKVKPVVNAIDAIALEHMTLVANEFKEWLDKAVIRLATDEDVRTFVKGVRTHASLVESVLKHHSEFRKALELLDEKFVALTYRD